MTPRTDNNGADWRERYRGPDGQKRAKRALMLGDHGLLRTVYDNSHEVDPGRLWRTYQPSPRKLEAWQDRGIKTVVNLRGEAPSGFLYLEEQACTRLGLRLECLRAYSREAPSPQFLHALRALYQRIEYPAIIHCKSGADRAGLAATLYLFFEKRLPLDQAMEQLSFRYGHVRQGKTGVIDAALHQYMEYAENKGIRLDDIDAFFDWADSPAYDPVAIKKAFRPTFSGRFLSDTLLRRE